MDLNLPSLTYLKAVFQLKFGSLKKFNRFDTRLISCKPMVFSQCNSTSILIHLSIYLSIYLSISIFPFIAIESGRFNTYITEVHVSIYTYLSVFTIYQFYINLFCVRLTIPLSFSNSSNSGPIFQQIRMKEIRG